MASKFRRAQRIGDPLRFPVGTGLLERWRWEQDVVHERKPRDAGGPQIEPPPSDCSMCTWQMMGCCVGGVQMLYE